MMKSRSNVYVVALCIAAIMVREGQAQTTVTLANQCNCEVIKSNLETVAGATTPAGPETGSLLVDPSGDIFYWDGDSWE